MKVKLGEWKLIIVKHLGKVNQKIYICKQKNVEIDSSIEKK